MGIFVARYSSWYSKEHCLLYHNYFGAHCNQLLSQVSHFLLHLNPFPLFYNLFIIHHFLPSPPSLKKSETELYLELDLELELIRSD